MTAPCSCESPHVGKRIVLTGGPGAGKTAVLELIRKYFELLVGGEGLLAITLCDRGTVDGLAYWPGPPDEMLAEVGSSRDAEVVRYDAVIHLRTPSAAFGYNRSNSLRIEPAVVAAEIDLRIEEAWRGHPRRFFVDSREDFLVKAAEVLRLLRAELPECCRGHAVPEIDGPPGTGA